MLFCACILWQCARQSQPAGGPKDIDPPVLLTSVPANGQKNFSGKNIVLQFDEYVKLKDAKEEIIITPSPGPNTKFLVKKKSVTIVPEKNWNLNTTYSIAFRNGIQDLNEGNPAEDLHLAFSTGATIDSLSIKGYITETFKEKPPEKLLVALYQQDTFDIFKHRPVYFTKTDKQGRFSINNLKEGKYYIYAFEDRNKNTKVDSKTESFGYLTEPIQIPEKKDSVHIPLIRIDMRKLKLTSIRNTSTISIIRFNKPLDSIKIWGSKQKFLYTHGDKSSEINVVKNFPKEDSLKLLVHAVDSVRNVVDTTVYVKYSDGKLPDTKYKTGEWNITINPVTYQFDAKMTMSKILKTMNLDSIYFQLDTSRYQSVSQKEFSFDTLIRQISFKTKLNLDPKEKKPRPVLLVGKSAFISIDQDSSKSQDVKIQIPNVEETGIVSVEIATKSKNFEVNMVSVDNKILYKFRDEKKHTFTYVKPAEYKIIITVDENNNGRWDAGDFYKKIPPEKVVIYKTIENKYSFPVRANWEVGPLLITF